jgi:hypothetical protein
MSDVVDNTAPAAAPLRTVVVACAVLEDEIRHYAAGLPQVAHVDMLQQGLHNEPDKLRVEVQAAIDRAERDHDAQAVVLGYGLCSRGTEGITGRSALVVIPRAHDCITLLLGDKDRYATYVRDCPGTYWYSPGWNKAHTPPGKERYEKLLAQYVQKYGQEDAQFLMESEQQWFRSYTRATYVDLGVGVTPRDLQYTQSCAQWLGWQYDHQRGDPALLLELLRGPWSDERFVVLRPGQTIRMTADERVIEATVNGKPGKKS